MPTAIKLTESQFLDQVIDAAHYCGWLAHHSRPAWTSKGCRTPIQGDKGAPDLLLAKNGRVILAELKADGGKLTPEQLQWRKESGSFVFYPSDFDRIVEILRME